MTRTYTGDLILSPQEQNSLIDSAFILGAICLGLAVLIGLLIRGLFP